MISRKKRYMLDENCYSAVGQIVPNNMFNVKDIMRADGFEKTKKPYHDSVILDVSIKHNYTIITKDKGLALIAILKGRDVVFSNFEGLHLLKGTHTKHIKRIEDLK